MSHPIAVQRRRNGIRARQIVRSFRPWAASAPAGLASWHGPARPRQHRPPHCPHQPRDPARRAPLIRRGCHIHVVPAQCRLAWVDLGLGCGSACGEHGDLGGGGGGYAAMTQAGVVAGSGVLTDWISLGVLASSVPRDAVDEAVAAAGKGAKRAGGKLPPHVMVYLVMALALFADDDYEEVAARLAETLRGWGCWGKEWEVPTRGGITQARQRLGPEPLEELFGQVAVPVADLDTAGAFFGPWRLMAVDGMEWDVPDTAANRAFFGSTAGPAGPAPFPKVRVVTVSECGSHAAVAAAVGPVAGGKGSGEQALARRLYPGLDRDWLLIADRNFYSFAGRCT